MASTLQRSILIGFSWQDALSNANNFTEWTGCFLHSHNTGEVCMAWFLWRDSLMNKSISLFRTPNTFRCRLIITSQPPDDIKQQEQLLFFDSVRR